MADEEERDLLPDGAETAQGETAETAPKRRHHEPKTHLRVWQAFKSWINQTTPALIPIFSRSDPIESRHPPTIASSPMSSPPLLAVTSHPISIHSGPSPMRFGRAAVPSLPSDGMRTTLRSADSGVLRLASPALAVPSKLAVSSSFKLACLSKPPLIAQKHIPNTPHIALQSTYKLHVGGSTPIQTEAS